MDSTIKITTIVTVEIPTTQQQQQQSHPSSLLPPSYAEVAVQDQVSHAIQQAQQQLAAQTLPPPPSQPVVQPVKQRKIVGWHEKTVMTEDGYGIGYIERRFIVPIYEDEK